MIEIAIIGTASEDTLLFVERLPEENEVCFVERRLQCCGGRGVIPALVMSALGLEAHLCTVIGADARDRFEEFFAAHALETSGIKWDTGSGATHYTAFVEQRSGALVGAAVCPRLDWTPTERQLEIVREASAIYVSTNSSTFNCSLLSVVDPSEQCVVHNLGVLLVPSPTNVSQIIHTSTLIIGNHLEMAEFTTQTKLQPRNLFDAGPQLEAIVITYGSRGAVIYERGDGLPKRYSARFVARVGSTVGAGDAFAGGLVGARLLGHSFCESVAIGIETGALAVEAELSYPNLAHLRRVVDRLTPSGALVGAAG